MEGRLHSVETLGAADGPGLRCVFFLQGCPLRCAFCHNPDTWDASGGAPVTVEELLIRARRCRPYFGTRGGVTVSGGEPLMQAAFVAELFRRLRMEGIHTARDTSGSGAHGRAAREVLELTDLVLCDLKFPDGEGYRVRCGGSLEQTLRFLCLTETLGAPLWVRHVVIPGLTDSGESVREIACLAARFRNLRRLELLPFRTMCAAKYDALGIPFPLRGTPGCPEATLAPLREAAAEVLPAGVEVV